MSIVCRLIREHEVPAAMRVWAKCFPEDSEAFIRYYFEKRTSTDAILAAFDGSDMLGALHMLPCIARFFGENRKVGFVAGVGTVPEARGKGVAGDLMRASFAVLRERNCSAAMLKPSSQSLFHFYRRFGYETLSNLAYMEREFDEKTPCARLTEPSPAAMLTAFEAFTNGYDGVILRGERDFTLLLEEASLTHSLVYASAAAYALGERRQDGVVLTEIAGQGVLELVNAIAEREGRVTFALPADHADAKGAALEPFDMLRILDAETFLLGMPAKNGLRIAVEDADVPQNAGTCELIAQNGRVTSCRRVKDGADERMNAAALAGGVSGAAPNRWMPREKPCFGTKSY